MIDRITINKIMDAANIVEVVSEFVTLRKAGVNYKGLCPFHQEKTPSFVVSPSKGVCHCFSCGKGGNAVHFLMEHEQLNYVEALKWLAKKYGIEVKERELTDKEKVIQNERESLFIINNWADEYFQNILFNTPDGLSIGLTYFRNRGIRDDIMKKFQLGYSLEKRDALPDEALRKGYSEKLLLDTGICYKTDRGQLVDRYHGRVIFPVHTISGKIVAFGGRILSNNKKIAKYVNSPESEIYHKSSELYGLYLAKHSIVKYSRCFLVEGYMDVISMFQNGIENVVASSGTSLTNGQINLLHRFTENVTVLYDGDAAGIKASLRGIDMLLSNGMNIKVLLLPDGEDPDSFAQKNSSDFFIKYIKEHQVDFLKFKTQILLKDAGDDPIKRASLVTDIVKSISVIPDAIIRSVYIKECSSMLKVDEALLIAEVNKFHRFNYIENKKQEERERLYGNRNKEGSRVEAFTTETVETPAISTSKFISNNMKREETLLLQALLKHGEKTLGLVEEEDGSEHEVCVIEYIWEELNNDDLSFGNELYQKIFVEAHEHCHDEGFIAKTYFMYHPEMNISVLSTKLCTEKYQLSKIYEEQNKKTGDNQLEELIPHLVGDYKYSYISELLEKLLLELKEAETMKDESKYMQIMTKYRDMKNIERFLAKKLGDRVITKI